MTKRAFITGITGQDGSYLAEYLHSIGYQVFGIIRRNSVPENQSTRISDLRDKNMITTFYGDVTDPSSIERILTEIQPDEIYNLAAQSHVRISSDIPLYTSQTNAIGTLNMLEAFRKCCPKAKFYQASSSEMFGNSIKEGGLQNEDTPMHPVSPYGCSKLFAHHITKHYRTAYKLYAVNGILFNHESPRRGENFVTNKVVKAAVQIKHGLKKTLELGNMDTYRDWGHSKDYVRAMHLMLNHTEPIDFVVSTGVAHSVRDLCQYVFNKLDMDYNEFVVQNEKYIRVEELQYLKGDCSKIKEILNWKPEYTFETLLDDMIDHWEAKLTTL
jgi:GDPmannose 4,6-dehydratase